MESDASSRDVRADEGMRRVAARLRAQLARVRSGQGAPAPTPTEEAPEDRSNSVGGLEAGSAQSTRSGTRILDHDHVVWLGDTNSRLHWPGHLGGMPLQQARQKVQQRRFGELLALDQLTLMRRDRMAFHDFEEHPICFVPSYKWHPGTDAYDMRSQKHVPEPQSPDALRLRKLRARDEDALIASLAEFGESKGGASAPAPAPAGSSGVPKEVWMGYNRLFAHDYFERWGHWSTGGPRKLPGQGSASAPAPAPSPS
eukprot:s613_g5.t3